MPHRSYASTANYRFGFQDQENDNEVKGLGNQISFDYRVYDSRLGKFLSIDPLYQKYPQYTPYHFSSNQPIHARELEGLESEFDLSIPNSPNEVDLTHWKINNQHKAPNSQQWIDVHGNRLTFDKAKLDINGNPMSGFQGKDHWHFENSSGERLTAEGTIAKSYKGKEVHLMPGTKTTIKIKPSVSVIIVDGISATETKTSPVVKEETPGGRINGKIGGAMVVMDITSSVIGIISGDPDALINWFGSAQIGELKLGHLGSGDGNYYMIVREEVKEWTENGVKYKTVTRTGQNYQSKELKNKKYTGRDPVGPEIQQTEKYKDGKKVSTSGLNEKNEISKS